MEKFTGKYKSDDELPIIKRKQKTRKLCTSRMSWIIYHDNDTRADKFAVSSILSIFLFGFLQSTQSFELTQFLGHAVKRNAPPKSCHPYEPFKCPEDDHTCISIQYLCDGAPDCPKGYDEDPRLCTAAKRPPVEETKNFLKSLMASHGPNYLEKLFGHKARDSLEKMGGVDKVSISLSESQTVEDFGAATYLPRTDVEHLRHVFNAVENGDIGLLKSLGIKDSEIGDVKFFLEKLIDTGFLD